ncbi:MAG TPA: NAD(P)/FAD-dependent oxidoreductase [Solirubrobacteraceae bacterium]|jgi:NADH dehydrogenase|nr:NAD(P)/FAD-dependent oxidoreductase [Solirubrobacteraceae bacterium]
MSARIVIAGGGFGGFYAARALERIDALRGAQVTLVNDANYLLYTPLLPGAAGATLDPRHVLVPLREQLRHTDLLIGSVTGRDGDARELAVRRIDGEQIALGYDHLLVALGSVSRALPIPGLVEHAIGLKSLGDATALRNKLLGCLDIAESLDDPARRAEYLGFVFVGAGYAGLEGLAELQDFAAQAIELYPRCRAQGMRWLLVEARERIVPEVPPSLSAFAARELIERGIEIRTGATLRAVEGSGVELSDGERVPARTVVWTAGVRPSPVVAELGLPLGEGGRIAVDEQLRVGGRPGVWAIGDCAAVPDPARPGHPCPPTAQHAIRQGRLAAHNIAADLGVGHARPFRYRTAGVVAELGRGKAVAITLGVRWRGLPAWIIARTYHLLLMPGFGRKLRLFLDWNIALLFGRDTSAPGRLGSPTVLQTEEQADVERRAETRADVQPTRTRQADSNSIETKVSPRRRILTRGWRSQTKSRRT